MMERSETINELAAALAAAQGKIENASKDSANPYFRSRYADLASIWDAIRGPLSEHGLAVVQPVRVEGSSVTVTTLLAHASGQWISSDLTMTAQRQIKDGGGWEKLDTPQAIGSCITYARRYALAAMAGVAPEDDDAEGAQGRRQEQQRQQRPEPAQPTAQDKPARPVPEQLVKVFERMLKEPAHFSEACEMLMHKLEDEQGVDGMKKYDRIQRAFAAKFTGGRKPGMKDLQDCLLDLWEAADVAPKA
jgi:hypothetical protein